MVENGLDIALLVVLGYFFIRGAFRGVVKEVVAVLGLFVAFWVASVYWPLGSEHLKTIFGLPGQRGIISFIVIFIVVYFLISIISIFVDKVVKMTISPVVSSLLGAVAGLIKGILVCGIILAGAENFLRPTEKFFTSSALWPYMKPVTEQAKAWMPEGLRNILNIKQLPPRSSSGVDLDSEEDLAPWPDLESVDWKTIEALLIARPEAVSPGWRDKFRNISGGETLSPEDLKRFISEHPALFAARAPTEPDSTAPTWPQPAE